MNLKNPPQGRVYLIDQMLRGKTRQYIIDKVKKPLQKAITVLSLRFPEPTRENILYPNSHLLLDARDKFFEYECNKGKKALFQAIWKIFIDEYEHDPYYRYRIDWIIEEMVEAVISGKWKPRPTGRPSPFWTEPDPHGLYEGRNFKQYIGKL